jgi:putative endonuclease
MSSINFKGKNMAAFVYILKCADDSFYTGVTRTSLEYRVAQHNQGVLKGYTASRCPVTLVFSQQFDEIKQAISAERQIKGWSRAKKVALIDGRFEDLPFLSQNRMGDKTHPSTSSG